MCVCVCASAAIARFKKPSGDDFARWPSNRGVDEEREEGGGEECVRYTTFAYTRDRQAPFAYIRVQYKSSLQDEVATGGN